MCIYNIHAHTSCSHLHIFPDLCAAKTQSPYPYMWPCTYHEQHTTRQGPCPHPVCTIKFHTSLIVSRKHSLHLERHSRRHQSLILPLIHWQVKGRAKRTCWRYIMPQPTPVPREPPHAGFYDLELNVLYPIPEVEEPSEIVLDLDDDERRWSWDLRTATAMTIVRPTVRLIPTSSKLIPKLPESLVNVEVMELSPMPVIQAVRPLSLHAVSPAVKEKMLCSRSTMHVGSEVRARSAALAKVTRDESRKSKHVTHSMSLHAASCVITEPPTPRRITRVDSTARKQAVEFVSRGATPCPISTHPTTLTPTAAYTFSSHGTMQDPSATRGQHIEIALERPSTLSEDVFIPLSLSSGPLGFTARTAVREFSQAEKRAEFNHRRYARIFDTSFGAPIISIPGSEARLSAVGVGVGVAPRPAAQVEKVSVYTPVVRSSLVPVVHAFIVEKTPPKPAPKLRRVSRMTLAFDD